MVLGDHFPAAMRQAANEQRLSSGAVLYLEITFPEDRLTKEKYLVVAAVDEPNVLLLPINTEINALVARQPALNRCQIKIEQASHTFLDYDSYVACHKALVVSRSQIVAALEAEMSRYQGEITAQLRQDILNAIRTQPPTMSKIQRDTIIAALSEEEEEEEPATGTSD
jgi:hypothetical protein